MWIVPQTLMMIIFFPYIHLHVNPKRKPLRLKGVSKYGGLFA